MAKDLRDLSKGIGKLRKNIRRVSNQIKQDVSLAISDNLIDVTPVDTSRALSNWQASLNTPENSSNFGFFEGDFASTLDLSTPLIKFKNFNIISSSKPEQTIFISNNIEYIVDLDAPLNKSRQFDGSFDYVALRTAEHYFNTGFKINVKDLTINLNRREQTKKFKVRRSPAYK